jgi:ribosomal protein L24
VKLGRERDVALALLRKAIAIGTPGVLSVFTQDKIQGYVYIEATTVIAIHSALEGTLGIPHFRHNTPHIDMVSLDDRVKLLTMTSPSTDKLSWVRVQKRGRYKDDLGLVIDTHQENSYADILLVPRILLDHKRKRQGRPAAALFDVKAVKRVYGENAIQQRNQLVVFKGDIYSHGLVEIRFASQDLSSRVDPTPSDLELFRQSRHPSVATVIATMVHFYIGDRVRIIAGTFQGMLGWLLNIDDRIATVTASIDEKPPQTFDVMTWEIERFFCLGDAVEVHCGDQQGVKGFIIDLKGPTAIIYERGIVTRGGILHEYPGQEV